MNLDPIGLLWAVWGLRFTRPYWFLFLIEGVPWLLYLIFLLFVPMNTFYFWLSVFIYFFGVSSYTSCVAICYAFSYIEQPQNRNYRVRNALKRGFQKLLPVAVGNIIYFLICTTGLLFLIIPGIYLGVRLFFFKYYLMIDDYLLFASFRRSWRLIGNWGRWWQFFWAFAAIFIAEAMIYLFMTNRVRDNSGIELMVSLVLGPFISLFYVYLFGRATRPESFPTPNYNAPQPPNSR